MDRGESRLRKNLLCSNDHQISILSRRHPLADPFLGLLVLVVVGGVDEVAAGVVVGV